MATILLSSTVESSKEFLEKNNHLKMDKLEILIKERNFLTDSISKLFPGTGNDLKLDLSMLDDELAIQASVKNFQSDLLEKNPLLDLIPLDADQLRLELKKISDKKQGSEEGKVNGNEEPDKGKTPVSNDNDEKKPKENKGKDLEKNKKEEPKTKPTVKELYVFPYQINLETNKSAVRPKDGLFENAKKYNLILKNSADTSKMAIAQLLGEPVKVSIVLNEGENQKNSSPQTLEFSEKVELLSNILFALPFISEENQIKALEKLLDSLKN